MWLGRKVLGEEITVGVQCRDSTGVPSNPTDAPTIDVVDDAGTSVVSMTIPPVSLTLAPGMFAYNLPLDDRFSVGRYCVRYSWVISAVNYAILGYFEIVAGGDVDGLVNAMFYLDRPDGRDWIVTTSTMGVQRLHRGPQLG